MNNFQQVRPNAAKQKLNAGGTIYSSSVRLPEPGLCEMLGYAGFDFVLLDGEHGAMDPSTLDRLIPACHAGATAPIVRIARKDDNEDIMRSLDLGAQGIMMPHCCTAADAARLKRAALYPPVGNRGFGPGRGTQWGRVSTADYFKDINDSILLLSLIEDFEGLDNIDAIAAEKLDVLWIGTGDLALAFGVPGQRTHPKVMEAANTVLAACKKHNIVAGYPASDATDANRAREMGFRAIGYGGAEQYVMQGSRQFLDAVAKS